MASQNYRDLRVWQKAVDFVCDIYKETRTFPADERFGLISQMRRCAVSIPSNIAEGQGRASAPEFIRFLRIAYGSLRELETQLIISQRLGFISEKLSQELMADAATIGKLLNGLIRSKQ